MSPDVPAKSGLTRGELALAKSRAPALVAADTKSDEQIAAELGVDRRTLTRWKSDPDFIAAVADEAKRLLDAVRAEGIRNVSNRVASQDKRWSLLQQVIDERAADMADGEIAGGKTGLLTRKVVFVKVFVPTKEATKRLMNGDDDLDDDDFIATKQSKAVMEYSVDIGILAEMRAIETQSAKELGQLIDRSVALTKTLDVSKMSDEELEALASG